MPNTIDNRNYCQFFLNDEDAATLRDMTKVEALGPAARALVLMKIEEYRNEKQVLSTRVTAGA